MHYFKALGFEGIGYISSQKYNYARCALLAFSIFFCSNHLLFSQSIEHETLITNDSITKIEKHRKYFPNQDSSDIEFKMSYYLSINRESKKITTQYLYDGHNKTISSYNNDWNMTYQKGVDSTGTTTSYAKVFYNEEGKLIKGKNYFSSKLDTCSKFHPMSETTYFYNKKGFLNEALRLVFRENIYIPSGLKTRKGILIYDKKGRLIKEETFELEHNSNNYKIINSTIHTYYPKSNLLKKKTHSNFNEKKVKTSSKVYYYDNGKLIKIEHWKNKEQQFIAIYLYKDGLLSEIHSINQECKCLTSIIKYVYK